MTDPTPTPDSTPPRRRGRPAISSNTRVVSGKRRSNHDTWYPEDFQVDRLKWHAERLGPGATKTSLVRRAVTELLQRLDDEAGVDTTDPTAPQAMPGINWHSETTRQFLTGSVARRLPGKPRRCFYIDPESVKPGGYVPFLVFENEPGYRQMTGKNGKGAWYWGRELEEAEELCELVNSELFDITPEEAEEIVAASMQLTEES